MKDNGGSGQEVNDPVGKRRTDLVWRFPLPRPHTGVPLANGLQGLLLWAPRPAENSPWSLMITVGRAGFWDRRGGGEFDSRINYRRLRRLLESGDTATIEKAFASDAPVDRPQQLPGGRVVLKLPPKVIPVRARISMTSAVCRIDLNTPNGPAELRIRQAINSRHDDLAWVEFPKEWAGGTEFAVVPAYELAGAHPPFFQKFRDRGLEPPERFSLPGDDGIEVRGFVQSLPADEPLALAARLAPGRLAIATGLGSDAKSSVVERVSRAGPSLCRRLDERAGLWWCDYAAETPAICVPDGIIQRSFDRCLYTFAGLTAPSGLACTLQGALMEDHTMPPWSNDFHFNINLQMIYWPALALGRTDHLDPLWRLLREWMPRLKRYAARFFETGDNNDALMLPHAVDDRCQVIGQFWTGTIDHACTAWVAQLAWLHYRYTTDETVLYDIARPLLRGAFEGFRAMLESEDTPAGPRLRLPVSVSPEFKSNRMDAWGPNATFQLAACHMTAQLLTECAEVTGERPDPRWREVLDRLPPYTLMEAPLMPSVPERSETRIALWQGMDLIESHRHHSHLAFLYPFATVDPFDPPHRENVRATLRHWIREGTGAWVGWSFPWAALIHSRCGNIDAAVASLRHWSTVFTNVGEGSLIDSDFPGSSVFAPFPLTNRDERELEDRRWGERMQVDGAMGVLSAVMELFVQCRRCSCDGRLRTVLSVLPGIPRKWRDYSFTDIRAEGGFRISGRVRDGRRESISVTSPYGGVLRIDPNMGSAFCLNQERVEPNEQYWFTRRTRPGETLRFTPVPASAP